MSGSILPSGRIVPGLIEKLPALKPPSISSGNSVDEVKFSDMLGDLVNSVNEIGNEAGRAQKAFLAGEPIELHQVMIKGEEAGISMDILLEVRNRLVSTINDIMRMPL